MSYHEFHEVVDRIKTEKARYRGFDPATWSFSSVQAEAERGLQLLDHGKIEAAREVLHTVRAFFDTQKFLVELVSQLNDEIYRLETQ